MPKDVQDVIAAAIKEAALAQCAAMVERNKELQTSLAAGGLTFIKPDVASFRDKLTKSGFYGDMKKFGDEAWSVLEKNSNARA